MTDDPIMAAIRNIPHNELTLDGGVTQADGARVHGQIERDLGSRSFGVEAQVAQKTGWSVAGFFRRVWGSKA